MVRLRRYRVLLGISVPPLLCACGLDTAGVVAASSGSSSGGGHLRDMFLGWEQYACYAAFFAALWLLWKGLSRAQREQSADGRNLLDLPAGRVLRPDDVRPFVLSLNDAGHPLHSMAACQAMSNGLVVFEHGGSIQEVLSSVQQDVESLASQMDTSLGFVRYLIWAIPAIGFVGTVRGMGDALRAANLKAGVDSSGIETMLDDVTGNLGVAFYTTLVALLLSLVLMWIFHHVQQTQERTALAVERSCRSELIRVLRP